MSKTKNITLISDTGSTQVPYWHLKTWNDLLNAMDVLAGSYPNCGIRYTPQDRPEVHALLYNATPGDDPYGVPREVLAAVTVEENYEDYMNFGALMDEEFPGWEDR